MTDCDQLTSIATVHGEYPVAAYAFVADALKEACCQGHGACDCGQHVAARDLVDGVLNLAGQRFGLLAAMVLRSWNLKVSADVGRVTYHLIEHGVFGKQADDAPADFQNGPDFSQRLRELVIAAL